MSRSTITQYRINHGKRKGNSIPISVLELYLLAVVMMMIKEMLVTVTSGCVHYTLEDILDTEVAEKEMEFLDEECDELPVEGVVCPVSGCVNGKHVFKKYTNYIGHFDRFQKRNIFIYKNEL
uniref:Uncharacterized protein n=1 Tax=Magallana gigas TaxID=29159 RepID=A0A8W8MHL9_MAGGI